MRRPDKQPDKQPDKWTGKSPARLAGREVFDCRGTIQKLGIDKP